MSFLDAPINLSDLPEPESHDYSPIPEGSYNAIIKAADLSPTKDGSGQYIKVRFDVLGPTHAGRVLFSNLNIQNKSGQAENIGRQQLASIMKAGGIDRVENTEQLIGIFLSVKVGVREASGQYAAQNEIKSYSAIDGASPIIAPQKDADARIKAAPPWAKK